MPQLRELQQENAPVSLEELKREERQAKMRLAISKKVPAFGFDNLLADWTFLQFLEYFGDDEVRAIAGYDLTLDYFEIILDRDPRFLDAYAFAATAGSLYAARPREVDELIAQGLRSLSPNIPSHSYYIWRHKAVNELLFLDNAQEQAQRSFEKAAEWASPYPDATSQQIAQSSRKTAQFLARNPESNTAKVTAWGMVLQAVSDAPTRKRAIREIEKLGGKVIVTPEGSLGIIPPAKD